MVNQTVNTTSTGLGAQEIYATLLCTLCIFFNSFVALGLWKIDILHLILIELICLNIGTLMGVVVFELIPEVYNLVNQGTLDFVNVTVIFTIGWMLAFTIEKFLKRGKGNKYKRLMKNTGLDGSSGPVAKSLKTVVAEQLALKEAKKKQPAGTTTEMVKLKKAEDENSVSSKHDKAVEKDKDSHQPHEVDLEKGPSDAVAVDVQPQETKEAPKEKEKASDGSDSKEHSQVAHEINFHDPETEPADKKPPSILVESSSTTSINSLDSDKSPSSGQLASFNVDDANLSPKAKEMEKALEGDEDEAEELARKVAQGEDFTLIIIMLMGDMIHNFVDGGVVATAFHINSAVGVATFIGVFLEEIPHLTATFAVFVQAGAPIWKAMALNAFGATPFIIGASIILIVLSVPSANQNDVNYLVPFACGSFLYVTLADLVPIVSMYWHGWIRAFSHMSAVGTGLLLQASIRVYDTVSGSQD